MNKLNLSPRIVEYLLGILATAFIVVGTFLYILQEPARIVSAQDEQLQTDLLEAFGEDSMELIFNALMKIISDSQG